MNGLLQSTGVVLVCAGAALSGFAHAAATAFDGRWAVLLSCPDTRDKNGLVKGYEYHFTATVQDGALEGKYGAPGHPSSVVYTGQVSAEGVLDIQATGNTGRSDYSVGKVAQGTQYTYTMRGKLEASRGQATRSDLRPCTASFSKL